MIKIKCDVQDTLELDQLTEFQGGLKVRENSDYEKIERSIRKHGFSFPFFVWKKGKTNYLLDGHGRYGALQRIVAAGEPLPPLPVVYVKCKDENEAKEILLKLNSTYGHMTAESVKDFLGDLQIEIDDIALPKDYLDLSIVVDDIDADTKGDDEAPEVNEDEPADSQPGEMYELGDHILMCGDSTNAEDVARLMGGIQADVCVTDPPYNVNIIGGSHADPINVRREKGCKTIMNDKMESTQFRQFLCGAFSAMRDSIKDGAPFYIWYASCEVYNFTGACADVGLDVHQELIWKKNALILGRQDYQWIHEPCLYGWKKGSGHAWYNDRKQTTVIECKRPTKSTEHPTMKPVELFEYQIKNSSKAGDIVLDLFGGSGTTIISSARCGRKARVMEKDPHYCDVIRKRWTRWAKDNGKKVGSGGLE